MASFVVMEPPRSSGAEPGVGAVFVRDGFSVLALIAPVIWLLWHRLWLEAILALAAAVAVATAGAYAGLGPVAPVVSLLVSLYIAFEGQAMRMARMRRLGWEETAVIEAPGRSDAEDRYYAEPTIRSEPVSDRTLRVPVAGSTRRPADPALGLFGYPGS